MRSRGSPVVAVVLMLVACVATADVNVASSGTFTAAFLELTPRLEQVARGKVVLVTTSIGAGANSIPNRLRRGEVIDVVIASDAVIGQLVEESLVLADSRVDLVQSTIGVAVRAGAPRPDISTVEALRRALLEAKSVAYSSSVSGNYVSTVLYQQLGIAEQMAAKSRRIENERVGAVVARGEAELGFQQISELLPIEGIDFLGPIPAEVQHIGTFSAGVIATSQHIATARALIAFLASREADAAIRQTGLTPLRAE